MNEVDAARFDDPEAAATIAGLYDSTAATFADPPDAETVERLLTEPAPDPQTAPNDLVREGFERFAEWRVSSDNPVAAAADLASEHTRLFVGPRPALQVHESYYRNDFMGEPLADVQTDYDVLGIRPAPDLHEEADHAAVELAALRELAAERRADDRALFLAEHGWWFAELADDVATTADGPFYQAVALVAAGVVAFDAARLEVHL